MATFITLINYTRDGAQNMKDAPDRLADARRLAESMGGSIDQWYLTMGQYDAVVIGSAPDDEAIAKVLLAVGATGRVRTQTMRAFTEDEFAGLIDSMP